MSSLNNYSQAVKVIKVIKKAISRSQYRAASAANKEQLSLYYGIGVAMSPRTLVRVFGAKAQSRPSASNYKRSYQNFVASQLPISNLCVSFMRLGARI